MDHWAMVRIFAGPRRVWFVMALLSWSCSESQQVEPPAIVCPHGPVVIVHGLGQGPGIFDDLVAALVRRGMPRECLHVIGYSDGNLPIRVAAEKELAPFVGRVLAELGESPRQSAAANVTEKINLIGHSMGALSSRWFAAKIDPGRVRTWISTSGANHGTDWGCPQPAGTGHGDMCPAFARSSREGAVQYALNGTPGPDVDETPYGIGRDSPGVETVAADGDRSILYLTVSVPKDDYITPEKSLLIDGAGGAPLQLAPGSPLREIESGNFSFTESSGHDEILHSEALADFIYSAITAARPEDGSREPQ